MNREQQIEKILKQLLEILNQMDQSYARMEEIMNHMQQSCRQHTQRIS